MREEVLEELRHYFRPEFLNRVDEAIVFHSLTEEHLKAIVEIQLDALRSRLKERKLQIELSDEAREYLVRIGYDPKFGARPLKRAIQKAVENPLARLIIQGEVSEEQLILADYDHSMGKLSFNFRSVLAGEGIGAVA